MLRFFEFSSFFFVNVDSPNKKLFTPKTMLYCVFTKTTLFRRQIKGLKIKGTTTLSHTFQKNETIVELLLQILITNLYNTSHNKINVINIQFLIQFRLDIQCKF